MRSSSFFFWPPQAHLGKYLLCSQRCIDFSMFCIQNAEQNPEVMFFTILGGKTKMVVVSCIWYTHQRNYGWTWSQFYTSSSWKLGTATLHSTSEVLGKSNVQKAQHKNYLLWKLWVRSNSIKIWCYEKCYDHNQAHSNSGVEIKVKCGRHM